MGWSHAQVADSRTIACDTNNETSSGPHKNLEDRYMDDMNVYNTCIYEK